MKTTLEMPDAIFRKAKAKAAEEGIPLRQFVTEAVQEKLNGTAPANKPWLKFAGGLRHLHKETVRINKVIEEEFGKVEPEDWQ